MAATVVLGGKGAALSADSVYSVAYGTSRVQIDLSALQKISNSSGKSAFSSLNAKQNGEEVPLLSPPECRAALVVLANKLLQCQVRAVIPLFIERVLNNGIGLKLPASDDGVACAIAEEIAKLKDDFESGGLCSVSKDEFFVSVEEFSVMVASNAVTTGLSALAIHYASTLCSVADAVAALSCEAVQVNAKGFELEVSPEGFSNKTEIDVASDLRTLFFGSKMVTLKNQAFEGASSFFAIPSVHGCFREDLKITQSKVRIEINYVPYHKRLLQDATQLLSLGKTILSLAVSLKSVAAISIFRSENHIKMLNSLCKSDKFEQCFERQPSMDSLQTRLQSIFSNIATVNDEANVALVAKEILALLQGIRQILAWEAAYALSLIALREECIAAEKGGQEHDNWKEDAGNPGKQKGEKKKKGKAEIVLGKGTSFIRQTMLQITQSRLQRFSEQTCLEKCLDECVGSLCSFFDPKSPQLQAMIDVIKSLLESNESRRLPKIPKGTRDFKPEQMAIRERAFSIIVGVFKRHGAVALDTPVFELRETLMGKYGEDSKLIYDLADQGGEICSLRYDLTVPFARYLAMNNINNMKRYHIARVYRRDNPSKGRYREFYQCDFDIAGQCATMVYDFEVIKVLTELLDELNIGDYEVKLNHRKLLDGMLELCGVPQSKFRSICSSVDKLDKQSWDHVEKEMVEEKGLFPEVARKIGSIVLKRGHPLEMLSELTQEGSPFSQHNGSMHALEELECLFQFLEASGCLNKITFDLSLARGLDYYTGVIYEAVFKGTTQVGSIAAGGRYDNLVGMFSGKQVPAVGVSLGIERVFTIMEQMQQDSSKIVRSTQTQVLLVVLGNDMKVAVRLVTELWAAKLNAEFALTSSRKIGKHIEDALKSGIPLMLILGENELQKGLVILKDLDAKEQKEVPRDRIVEEVKLKLKTSNHSNQFVVVQ
eukprot:TRINITY_DN8803_c0_g1_i2.p1 TRINITY_DN8803_c0_g1~~TRINITY_DN8803_c0_g1_i2.p1  ORF type:complete len:988 (-),score=194.47 TRINITY_DN8803_c0_g1_i2:301-3126(-)